MSLIRIELQGFKSFRDKTVINFEHGYTCIVGPNGCGKSNVSDAIRWVLGEQSAKQQRVDTMKGVIFSGTATLPEMGYAEVTLVFDNSDGMFRTTYQELAITRKVFRSKPDNYYYINHTPCRRSDIIELMRDTGAGKESLSIIEQGAVSAIMRVKPEERRQIFDEAAGIAQSKAEKKKNLKILAETESGIALLQVRIDEMDKQLKPLLKEVEAAEKYEVYFNELQVLEYNMFIYKYENADKAKADLRAHIRDVTEYHDNQEALLARTKQRIEAVQIEQAENDSRTRAYLAQRETLKLNRTKASGDMQTHQAKLETLQSTLTTLQENLATAIETRDTTAVELEEARNVLQAKKDRRFDLELELSLVNANLQSVVSELEESESSLESATSERFADMSKLSKVHSEQAKAETEERMLTENIQKIDEDVAQCRAQIAEKQQQITQLGRDQAQLSLQNERIVSERRSRTTAINEARFESKELEKRIRELEAQIQAKEVNVQSMMAVIRDKKGFSKAVNYIVRLAQNNAQVAQHFVGVVGDLFHADARYAEAVEVALGAAINHIVTETQEDANYLINLLREAGVGRITCMPLNRIRGEQLAYEYRGALGERGVFGVASDLIEYDAKYDVIFQRLLGRIIVADGFDTAKYLDAKYRNGLKIVTLDGKLFDPSGTITGGSRRTQEEIALERDRQALESLKKEHANLVERKGQLEHIIEECEQYLSASRDQQDEVNQRYYELQSQIEALTSAVSQLQERIREQESTKVYLLARLERSKRSKEAAVSESGAIETSSLDRNQQMERARADKETKTAMREHLSEQKNALSMAISALDTEIANIERDIKRLGEENVRSTAAAEGLVNDIAQKQQEIEAHIAATPTLVFTEEEEKILERIDADINACDQKKAALQQELERLSVQVEELSQKISEAKVDIARDEGKIEKIDTELQTWTQRIFEVYGKTYEEVVYARLETFDHTKATSQITVLRGNITKLGTINHKAKEQYDLLHAEREEANQQMEDAIQAKANIEDVIARITAAMNKQFNTAFAQINENFQSTFAELFGGGKAELLLVDNPDSPDDQGVDISVQLPGKSKGPLSRLSGGEQTLTAIAILFAILKLKPMPFVVLDEAESALDDVNCNRFARFLRKYADNARFIVITHKKPTMENADVLFGVTMQQPGVSKVVSVNLESAIRHAVEDENK